VVQGLSKSPVKASDEPDLFFNGFGIKEKLFMEETSALQQLTPADY
jgi:hypothetical protein